MVTVAALVVMWSGISYRCVCLVQIILMLTYFVTARWR